MIRKPRAFVHRASANAWARRSDFWASENNRDRRGRQLGPPAIVHVRKCEDEFCVPDWEPDSTDPGLGTQGYTRIVEIAQERARRRAHNQA